MVATSATRDAENRDEFVSMVRDVLGVEPEVISGAEEAALSFAGATAGSPAGAAVLVADIGGGSTELVLGTRRRRLRAHSMDIGCVRMTERHLHDDPPTPDQIEATIADLQAAIAGPRGRAAPRGGHVRRRRRHGDHDRGDRARAADLRRRRHPRSA